MTSANLGGTTYQYRAGFDLLARATDLKVTRSSDQATMFDQTRTFDAAGNVSTSNTILAGGTDNQAFCYDEQNRLTWAGSTGTPPCTGRAISAGTLSAARYAQAFSYDTMGRLTNGPLGGSTYGDGNHLHAMTQAWPYTASYDAAGNMTCRSPNSGFSVGCLGQQTGDLMTYNNEGQLSNWQTPPGAPTITVAFLYDGQGNRLAQQSTQGGSTTTTVYLGSLEEDSTTGNTTTKTTYYYANGARIAMAVNGAFSYLASDGLGSANVTLNGTGTATASLLYAPYGSARYSSGSMPTDYGFTGQHADSMTGLDYYNARYYDPTAGQFASADTILPGNGFEILGLSRYAYVEGNPIIRTDPTGQLTTCECSDAAGNTGNPQPLPQVVAWNPLTWNWSAAAQVTQTQVPSIRPQSQDLVNGVQDWAIQSGQGVEYAANHPAQTALSNAMCGIQLAQCAMNAAPTILDTKDLSQGNYSKWAGHEIPNVLAIATGAGVAGFAGRALLAPAAAEAGPLEGVSYSPKVAGQMADINDPFHSFPTSVDQSATWDHAATVEGGSNDSQPYLHVNVPGASPLGNGVQGYYQFIVNSNNVVTHRFWSVVTTFEQFI
jgi:RHS repeat-associated protein